MRQRLTTTTVAALLVSQQKRQPSWSSTTFLQIRVRVEQQQQLLGRTLLWKWKEQNLYFFVSTTLLLIAQLCHIRPRSPCLSIQWCGLSYFIHSYLFHIPLFSPERGLSSTTNSTASSPHRRFYPDSAAYLTRTVVETAFELMRTLSSCRGQRRSSSSKRMGWGPGLITELVVESGVNCFCNERGVA